MNKVPLNQNNNNTINIVRLLFFIFYFSRHLVFSTSGGLGPAAKTFYKRLAPLIAEKHDQPYSLTLFWLCAKLSFSLLRSAIMCLRGSRWSYHRAACFPFDSAIELMCSAGRNA